MPLGPAPHADLISHAGTGAVDCWYHTGLLEHEVSQQDARLRPTSAPDCTILSDKEPPQQDYNPHVMPLPVPNCVAFANGPLHIPMMHTGNALLNTALLTSNNTVPYDGTLHRPMSHTGTSVVDGWFSTDEDPQHEAQRGPKVAPDCTVLADNDPKPDADQPVRTSPVPDRTMLADGPRVLTPHHRPLDHIALLDGDAHDHPTLYADIEMPVPLSDDTPRSLADHVILLDGTLRRPTPHANMRTVDCCNTVTSRSSIASITK